MLLLWTLADSRYRQYDCKLDMTLDAATILTYYADWSVLSTICPESFVEQIFEGLSAEDLVAR